MLSLLHQKWQPTPPTPKGSASTGQGTSWLFPFCCFSWPLPSSAWGVRPVLVVWSSYRRPMYVVKFPLITESVSPFTSTHQVLYTVQSNGNFRQTHSQQSACNSSFLVSPTLGNSGSRSSWGRSKWSIAEASLNCRHETKSNLMRCEAGQPHLFHPKANLEVWEA